MFVRSDVGRGLSKSLRLLPGCQYSATMLRQCVYLTEDEIGRCSGVRKDLVGWGLQNFESEDKGRKLESAQV
jgi:hypothetical protein